MAIVHRRIFYGKVGMASPLVDHMRAGDQILAKHGARFPSRILTDDMTGRSDRVVVEWEMESISDMSTALEQVMANSEGQAEMSQWMDKLATLIEYADGENWAIH
ncbi:MAG: hypothetical protein BZY87_00620 [SAR202 cluster bacterium Io17-Chloro-G6]|nr:MAG: hypothetical protein BZY87_00620 [SAR202 cluster bacterium Io17-Chloro-G6]